LTATYVNGDTATRPTTTPFDTVSSGTHSDGSASARPSGNFDSHRGSRPYTSSDSQSDNSVNEYRVTIIHPANQTVSRFYDRLTVTNLRTFYAAVSHQIISCDSISVTSQLNLTTSTNSIAPNALVYAHLTAHMQFSRRPGYRPQHAEREDKEANCEPHRSTSQKTTDRSSL